MTRTPNGRSGLEKILDEHDLRISTLVDRVGGLDHKVDAVISAIGDLKTAFAETRAKGTITFGHLISYTRDAAILIGLIVSGIVYINSAATSGRSSVIEYRIEQIERGHTQTWKDRPPQSVQQ